MEDYNCWEAKFESCYYSDRLLDKLSVLNEKTGHKVDISEVRKAVYYAGKYHAGQYRQSGEPYYTHPLEVAYMVSDYLFRTDIIVTAILHDTIEDTDLTAEVIQSIFGNIASKQKSFLSYLRFGL